MAYTHDSKNYQLNDLHQAMQYNAMGEPTLRTDALLTGTKADGTTGPFRIDTYDGSLVTITKEHYMIHQGLSFRFGDSITLGNAASQVYMFNTDGKYCHLTLDISGTAVTTFELFEASDRNGVTQQNIFNANRNSPNVSNVVIHKDVTAGTTDGVSIYKYASGTAQGNSAHPSAAVFDNEIILKTATKYLFRVTSGTAGNLCNVIFRWYEV